MAAQEHGEVAGVRMSAETRCQPPPNTPPGTLCVLTAEGTTTAEDDRVPFDAVWDGEYWHMRWTAELSVRKATLCGFRFERIEGV